MPRKDKTVGPFKDDFVTSYWEQSEVWIDELNELDKVRIPRTIAMIPQDVHSVLEVGCGNGRLLNQISSKYRTAGIDISKTALRFVKGKKAIAKCNVLPFQPECADLVICADVLEHLPQETLIDAVNELKRIAKRYLIIGVPFKERIEGGFVRCGGCRHIFSQFGHLRSFKCETLDHLFPDLQLIKTEFVGGPRKYLNRSLMMAWQRIGGAYWSTDGEGVLCPKCGEKESDAVKRNMMQKSFAKCCFMANDFLNQIIPDGMKPEHEIIRLYRKV